MAVEVPLLPLGCVLFPHMPMSLHIFEQRYRTMMRDCHAASTTFGVVAIREGVEVGATAVPFEVGTLAQLDEIEELEDGRYNLGVIGASRFRIESISRQRPYLVASVHYLQDIPAPADDTDRLAAAVTAPSAATPPSSAASARGTRSSSACLPIPSCSRTSSLPRCRSRLRSGSVSWRSTAPPSACRQCSDFSDARPRCSTGCWFDRRTTPRRPG